MTAFSNWVTSVIASLNKGGLKVPNTKANQAFLGQWQAAEGNGGANNPLNTTLGGYPSSGTVPGTPGVQNYSTPQAGAAATAATIQGYPAIVAALQSGNPYQPQFAPGVATSFATWSGHGTDTGALTGSYQAIVSDVASGKAPSGGGSSTLGSIEGGLGSAASVAAAGLDPLSLLDSGISSGASSALGGLEGALGIPSASSLEGILLRGAQIMGGFILAFAALYLLAKQVGLAPSASPPGPIGAAAGAVE